ncbi:hypothetical protein QBC38DRAFT_66602 [Podospora fimiseda]|uniref:Serine protease n=1 Tax=Podospora fimiseda TaxID=252190 RepID=A0AAN6YQX1_9PEZI|nr:hypothetical protein QBC38DRAFT_66602 [Podospora fimiseda]
MYHRSNRRLVHDRLTTSKYTPQTRRVSNLQAYEVIPQNQVDIEGRKLYGLVNHLMAVNPNNTEDVPRDIPGLDRGLLSKTGVGFSLTNPFKLNPVCTTPSQDPNIKYSPKRIREANLGMNGIPMDLVDFEDTDLGPVPHAMVSLKCYSNNGTWWKGSGFIITGQKNEQIVATAAHNLFELGLANSVILTTKVGTTTETVRYGTYAAAHAGYYSTLRRDVNDIAFILPNQNFPDVEPLRYQQTPETEKMLIDVFGFPKNAEGLTPVPNGRLFVSTAAYMKYPNTDGEVAHQGNTEQGFSGGPILSSNEPNTVIAVHTGAHAAKDFGVHKSNLGAPINRSGNDFEPFHKFLSLVEDNTRAPNDAPARLCQLEKLGPKGVAFTWDTFARGWLLGALSGSARQNLHQGFSGPSPLAFPFPNNYMDPMSLPPGYGVPLPLPFCIACTNIGHISPDSMQRLHLAALQTYQSCTLALACMNRAVGVYSNALFFSPQLHTHSQHMPPRTEHVPPGVGKTDEVPIITTFPGEPKPGSVAQPSRQVRVDCDSSYTTLSFSTWTPHPNFNDYNGIQQSKGVSEGQILRKLGPVVVARTPQANLQPRVGSRNQAPDEPKQPATFDTPPNLLNESVDEETSGDSEDGGSWQPRNNRYAQPILNTCINLTYADNICRFYPLMMQRS